MKLVPGALWPSVLDAFPFCGGLNCWGSWSGLPCTSAGVHGPAEAPSALDDCGSLLEGLALGNNFKSFFFSS